MENDDIPHEISIGLENYTIEMNKLRQLILASQRFFTECLSDSQKIPYLQITIISTLLRQAIELIIFSSLVIDMKKYKTDLKPKKYWTIKDIISLVEEKNPNWFPQPIEVVKTNSDFKHLEGIWYQEIESNFKENINVEWKIRENTIKKEDLIDFYKFLSDFIHYENHLKEDRKKLDDIDFINKTIYKLDKIRVSIINLTSTFKINLLNKDYIYYMIIDSGFVQGNIFHKKASNI